MVESSDKMRSPGERNGKPLQYSCLENPMNSMKRQKKIWHQKISSPSVQYPTGAEQRNSSRKNEEAGPNQRWCAVVDVSGGESKVQCCKNNIAQEPRMLIPRIKVNWMWLSRRWQEWTLNLRACFFRTLIWGISELKWMGMGEFNSDDHYIYYCGQESLRKNEVDLT